MRLPGQSRYRPERSVCLRALLRSGATENVAESELGLDKAISMAQAYESARRETQSLRGETPRGQKETMFSLKSSSSQSQRTTATEKECQECDGRGHNSDKCRFRTYTCRFCNVKGHIAKACRKKKQNEKETLPRHAKGGQRTHHIEEAVVSTIHTLSDTKGGPKVTLEVAGRDLELDVDTGASVTVLPHHVYSKYLKHVQLQKSKIAVQSYSGQPLRAVGEATVPVRYGDQYTMGRMLVARAPSKPPVLGRNWLQSIKLDWQSLFMLQDNPPDAISEFGELFQSDMGTLRGYQANITLQKGAIPRFHRPRLVPYALQKKVEEELGRLQNEGILKPVDQSYWAASIVVVRRGEGSLRICGDYKVTVNPYLEMNTYPLPNPQDLFATLAGGTYLSKLDMKQDYLQMKVSPQSPKYLTINTSKGLFAYSYAIRNQFRASYITTCNGRNLNRNFRSRLFLIVGKTAAEHDDRLRMVLGRLRHLGLRLKTEKCEFRQTQVQYLGHVIDSQGLRLSESKLTAIREAPEPSNVTQLKAYLGLLNYYNRFLPNLSTILQPLHDLLKKNRQWTWQVEQRRAFKAPKKKL